VDSHLEHQSFLQLLPSIFRLLEDIHVDLSLPRLALLQAMAQRLHVRWRGHRFSIMLVLTNPTLQHPHHESLLQMCPHPNSRITSLLIHLRLGNRLCKPELLQMALNVENSQSINLHRIQNSCSWSNAESSPGGGITFGSGTGGPAQAIDCRYEYIVELRRPSESLFGSCLTVLRRMHHTVCLRVYKERCRVCWRLGYIAIYLYCDICQNLTEYWLPQHCVGI